MLFLAKIFISGISCIPLVPYFLRGVFTCSIRLYHIVKTTEPLQNTKRAAELHKAMLHRDNYANIKPDQLHSMRNTSGFVDLTMGNDFFFFLEKSVHYFLYISKYLARFLCIVLVSKRKKTADSRGR